MSLGVARQEGPGTQPGAWHLRKAYRSARSAPVVSWALAGWLPPTGLAIISSDGVFFLCWSDLYP